MRIIRERKTVLAAFIFIKALLPHAFLGVDIPSTGYHAHIIVHLVFAAPVFELPVFIDECAILPVTLILKELGAIVGLSIFKIEIVRRVNYPMTFFNLIAVVHPHAAGIARIFY